MILKKFNDVNVILECGHDLEESLTERTYTRTDLINIYTKPHLLNHVWFCCKCGFHSKIRSSLRLGLEDIEHFSLKEVEKSSQ